jgi:transcriptional regulator with XRE-family HTH domain
MQTSIRHARVLKGYSQEYMAELLGLSQPQYSRIENTGSGLDIKKLNHIMRILEVDIAELVPGPDNELSKHEYLLDKVYKLEGEIRRVQIEARAALYEVEQLRKIMGEIFNSLNENDYLTFKKRLEEFSGLL